MKYEQTHEVWTNTQIEVYAKVIWKKDFKKKRVTEQLRVFEFFLKKKERVFELKKKKTKGMFGML